jgi:hypothetical protein
MQCRVRVTKRDVLQRDDRLRLEMLRVAPTTRFNNRSVIAKRNTELVGSIQSDLPCLSFHASIVFLIFRNYP